MMCELSATYTAPPAAAVSWSCPLDGSMPGTLVSLPSIHTFALCGS